MSKTDHISMTEGLLAFADCSCTNPLGCVKPREMRAALGCSGQAAMGIVSLLVHYGSVERVSHNLTGSDADYCLTFDGRDLLTKLSKGLEWLLPLGLDVPGKVVGPYIPF